MKPVVTERPRGILSHDDRQYLVGQSEIKPASERRRRHDIRERMFHAIQDAWLLLDYLEDRDLNQIGPERRDASQNRREFAQPYRAIEQHYRLPPLGAAGIPTRQFDVEPEAVTAFQEALTDWVALAARMIDHSPGLAVEHTVESGLVKYLAETGRTASVETRDVDDAFREELVRTGLRNPYEYKLLPDRLDEFGRS